MTPYVWPAGPGRFDCTALVRWVLRKLETR